MLVLILGFAMDRAQFAAASELRLGVGGEYWSYAESLPAPARSAESGFVPSVFGSFDSIWGKEDRFFFHAAIDTTYFPTNYNGTVSAPSYAPTVGTTLNYFLDAEPDIGVRIWKFRLYTGLGIRYWNRRIPGAGNSSVGSYTEQYTWLSLPAGIRFALDFTPRWGVEADLRLRMPIFSTIAIGYSAIDPTADDPSTSLGLLPGVRAELPLVFHFRDDLDLIAAPWFEYSAIGRSANEPITRDGVPTGLVYDEPSSKTFQLGMRFLVGLKLGH